MCHALLVMQAYVNLIVGPQSNCDSNVDTDTDVPEQFQGIYVLIYIT